MILTKPQAEAVYAAMCAMNNVGGRLTGVTLARLNDSNFILVGEELNGLVYVRVLRGSRGQIHVSEKESYDQQKAFAEAYGIAS